MARHTKGPWRVGCDSSTGIFADDGKQAIAHVSHGHVVERWARTLDEAQANAKLIAAAPMLEAAVLAWHNPKCDGEVVEGLMREALRALGKEA